MIFSDTRFALGIVFANRTYVLLGMAIAVISFLLYISIPVFTVPGNSYWFFLSSIPPLELAAIGGISALMGVVMSMQVYCWKNSIAAIANAGVGFAGFLSGAVSALFTSATCASCVSAVFSFIGFGGILFLIEHKAEILALTAAITFISLYFTSKKISGKCSSCSLPPRGKQ